MKLWKVIKLHPKSGERKNTWFQDPHAAAAYCDSISGDVYLPGFVCQEFDISGALLQDLVTKARVHKQRKAVPYVHNQEPNILPHPMLQAAS